MLMLFFKSFSQVHETRRIVRAVLLSLPLLPDIPVELHLHVPGEDPAPPLRLRQVPVRPFGGKAVTEFVILLEFLLLYGTV
jgi:hypothetical protein